ncbi:hypothetical protein RRG08_002417 [Elysia crispata]|uniref:Uncharacterized protein n=1 Tax=Elysia crispata TaxID=231223 RepID=A0AAE1DFF0_9GAST|nr:hypothetical protein RRG08_002417 [Elysia crispata]
MAESHIIRSDPYLGSWRRASCTPISHSGEWLLLTPLSHFYDQLRDTEELPTRCRVIKQRQNFTVGQITIDKVASRVEAQSFECPEFPESSGFPLMSVPTGGLMSSEPDRHVTQCHSQLFLSPATGALVAATWTLKPQSRKHLNPRLSTRRKWMSVGSHMIGSTLLGGTLFFLMSLM